MKFAVPTLASIFWATPALALAEPGSPYRSPLWAVPFCGMLLSIALGPLLAGHAWERHYGKIATLWALALVIPLGLLTGIAATARLLLHMLLMEYLPFILVLFALFSIAGGIHLRGTLRGVPWVNAALLALGALLASLIGTTGASMVLVRPLVRANSGRPHNAHVLIFFIFIVSNIGGALTPLGDPPLFLGFLRGVDFFWTLRHLWQPTLVCIVVLLAVFFVLDFGLWRREKQAHRPQRLQFLRIEGLVNFGLIGLAIAAIILSAAWQPGFDVDVFGTPWPLQNLARDAALLAIGLASLVLTPGTLRAANGFEWQPLIEVAKLFAAIFTCIIPVLAMLAAGREGPFAPLAALVTRPDGTPNTVAYFWATGLLSSVLDNAPTYLVFFELAGGDAARLMSEQAPALAAISMGAVFMGANTYIGNAPNFMVYAIARRSGVGMPGFFGYMLWSGAVLLPLFLLIGWAFAG